jgi:hypothetical protein
MYALATVPLIERLDNLNVHQVWYADDSAATGILHRLRSWWDRLLEIGPDYGYRVNDKKTWLVVKKGLLLQAKEIFEGTNVNITDDGHHYLGTPLGCQCFIEKYVEEKVSRWNDMLFTLSKMAETHPHPAFAVLTHGVSSKWRFIARTVPGITHLFTPLEETIRTKILPALTDKGPPNDLMREIFALPARFGGLGISPPNHLDSEFTFSTNVTAPLTSQILAQVNEYSYEIYSEQLKARQDVRKQKNAHLSSLVQSIESKISDDLKYTLKLAQEKGSSSWLTVIPIKEHGFALHKGDFRDALALRYGWIPSRCLSDCSCGHAFSVEHALSCPKGGLPIICHNEIRDLSANLLSEVCQDVTIEPPLQPLQGEQFTYATAITENESRLDMAARGFWQGRGERALFDIRIFNPYAQSNKKSSLSSTYRCHEKMKKRAYNQRVIDVEHATFTPVVFSITGGLGREATQFYKRLASLLSTKWEQPYSVTIGWLRCCLNFSLLRSSILCIQGTRQSKGNFSVGNGVSSSIDLVCSESKLKF